MLPIKKVYFKINRSQFEAFCTWLALYAKKVPSEIESKSRMIPQNHVLLHDFAHTRLVPSTMEAWYNRPDDKLYQINLPIGIGLVIHRQLINDDVWSENKLNQFHARLHSALSHIFSDEMLAPPNKLALNER